MMTIASKRAEPLTKGTFKSFSACCATPAWHDELVDFLRRDLFRVGAHDEMHFVGRGIDLIEQALEIDRAAGAGGADDEFHFAL